MDECTPLTYGARDDEKLQKFPVSEEELASLRESVTPGQVVQLPNGGAAAPSSSPSGALPVAHKRLLGCDVNAR